LPTTRPKVAVMVGALLAEIMNTIGEQAFNFDLVETTRLRDFVKRETYSVFVVRGGRMHPAALIALYQSHAFYAGRPFGRLGPDQASPRSVMR
jgi:hypothetical protein